MSGPVSYGVMKKFEELTEREVLALAIALEEEDERVYADFAEGLRQDYPATASMFEGMREEESGHRRRLLELYPKEIRRPYSADPAAGCARVCGASGVVAGASAAD